MSFRGTHTWPLIIQYHRCPSCGYIIESRQDFSLKKDKYVKDLTCKRCNHKFTLAKQINPKTAPLFGKPTRPEMDWESRAKE